MSTPRTFRRTVARPGVALTLALSAATLAACSGGADPTYAQAPSTSADAPPSAGPSGGAGTADSSPEAPSAPVVQVTETEFTIELSGTELAAGTTTFAVTNEGQASHNLVIESADGKELAATEIAPPGGSGTVQVDLPPGEYVVYCAVGNHRGLGMERAVTVS